MLILCSLMTLTTFMERGAVPIGFSLSDEIKVQISRAAEFRTLINHHTEMTRLQIPKIETLNAIFILGITCDMKRPCARMAYHQNAALMSCFMSPTSPRSCSCSRYVPPTHCPHRRPRLHDPPPPPPPPPPPHLLLRLASRRTPH